VRDLSHLPFVKPLANRFREVVSGSKDGRPDWVAKIAEGDDEGFFGPESAVWKIHGSVVTIIGGIRALLLQATHPAPLNGVASHSRYESDPLGRLAGTTKWLTITTFAARTAIESEARRVNAMHSRVQGDFVTKDGSLAPYKASDERYLLWVHCAFTDSFLKSYLMAGKGVRPAATSQELVDDIECQLEGDELADAYIAEWAKSAQPLGLNSAPRTLAELESALDDFRKNELALNDRTKEVVRFILKPPFSRSGIFFYSILAKAAILTLDDRDRELLGLKKPAKINLYLSNLALKLLSAILGHRSPSEKVARERISRIRSREVRSREVRSGSAGFDSGSSTSIPMSH
jgi:uncharacterized protein (DUF2236 family)